MLHATGYSLDYGTVGLTISVSILPVVINV